MLEKKQAITKRYRLLAAEYEPGGVYARTYDVIYKALHNNLGLLRPLEALHYEYVAVMKHEQEATDLLDISYYYTAKRLIGDAIDELHTYMYIAEED